MKAKMKLPVNYNEITPRTRAKVRLQYSEEQNGKCYYCESDLTGNPSIMAMITNVNRELFPKNFYDHPVHLHHDHNTGLTLGAVHCHCNAILWQFHGE